MASLNKIMLIGTLTADPAMFYGPDGVAVTMIRLATTERINHGHERNIDHTEYHYIVISGRLAEIAMQHLVAGKSVYVDGHLRTRPFKNGSGFETDITEVVAEKMQILGASP